MMEVVTDCRSEEGITVGLIDALISIARVLKPRIGKERPLPESVSEALLDLRQDEDMLAILES